MHSEPHSGGKAEKKNKKKHSNHSKVLTPWGFPIESS